MKRLTFEEMQFSRLSDAWCPVTGKAYGPNTPRVVADKILSSVGNIPTYWKCSESQGYVKYSNEVGCYDRGSSTHVFTDELDALETLLTGVSGFARSACGDGLSEDSRPLEVFTMGSTVEGVDWFLVDTLIHGNEPDGILGTLKAFEVLVTHPDFAPLRDQYSIALMPCCNPDGYYLGQRNLDILDEHPSGVPTGINLNRVWPWFWSEFVPTDGESKGYAPIECSLESQAMEDWRNPPAWGPNNMRKIVWALDQHATAGDGARYISRDRNFRNLPEGEWEKLWADWTSFRLLRAMQAKRIQNDAQPDLWANYYRSRWRPHWHSYLGTLASADNGGVQCCSFVGEHNKVPNQVITADLETYASASNYNFDHIIALALIAQGGVTERKAAVLVEHETGVNQVLNSNFAAWQPDEYRPGYWTPTRGTVEESSNSERHMAGPGRPLRLIPDLTMEITSPDYCDEFGGSDIVIDNNDPTQAIICARDTDGFIVFYTWNYISDPVRVYADALDSSDEHKQWGLGNCEALGLEGSFNAFGSGDATLDIPAVYWKWKSTLGVWTISKFLEASTPLEDAGHQYDPSSQNIFVFGGKTNTGSSAKVFKLDSFEATFIEIGTDLLGAGRYGMGSCHCSGGDLDGLIVLVGDDYDGELGLVVRVFNPGTGALDTYYPDLSSSDIFEGHPPAVMHSAVVYDGTDTIWFYGGTHPFSGDVYSSTWSITWNGAGFDEVIAHTLSAGLSDDGDPEDYAGDENWIRKFRHWRGLRIYDAEVGLSYHALFGGLELLPSGSDDADLANRRGFYAHYISTEIMARPADYTFGYMRYNTKFQTLGAYTKAVTSWSYRSEDPNYDDPTGELGEDTTTATSAYVRLNNAPGDSGTGTLTTRRLRTYYLHPPRWWWREHAALDLGMTSPDYAEDEWRAYIRMYRQNQMVLVDSPMIQTDTLWPSSWSPSGMTRAVEEASWPTAIDNRFYRVCFDWLPASSFIAASAGFIPLIQVGDSVANQSISVFAFAADTTDREYYRSGVVGPSNPRIVLALNDGEAAQQTISLPVFWGGYVKDGVIGRFESPLQIEVWHHARYGVGLIVRNGWAEGHVHILRGIDPSSWSSTGDITIYGGGWWGEPETKKLDAAWKNTYVEQENETGALLAGDRDPTFGQVSARGCFRYTETFTRADDPNLGDYWDVILQTGAGFNIASNQARCEELGWERWDAYPYVRDCSVFADVSAPDGCKVGLFTRLNWGMGTKLFAHGYAGYLECTGASTANLVIVSKFWNAGVQDEAVLATQAISYTESSTVTLELEAVGSTITLRVGAQTVSTTDATHARPGAFGILGETTGAGVYVYVDSVWAELRGDQLLRITE